MKKTQIYRLSLAVIGLIGIFLEIYKYGITMLMYYTLISNTLITLFLGYLVTYENKNDLNEKTKQNKKVLTLKGGLTMCIMLTFLVYHFMLAPSILPEKFNRLENYIVHYIMPIGFIIDTLFFDIKNVYNKLSPVKWTLIPLIYFVFGLLNGLVFKIEFPDSVHSPFPYFFMNVNKLGWFNVLKISVIILVIYILIGYVLLGIKKKLGKKQFQK